MNDAELVQLAVEVGRRLLAARQMLVTAESCTGGMIAATITAIAGSSDWFERGMVSYSNAAKQEMLGVDAATLTRHGAVSEATAAEMAEGALRHSAATIAVAVTGIAGPAGGSEAKPVGMVCFGWAVHGGATDVETAHFPGNRAAVREATVRHALRGVLARIPAQS